MRAVSDVPEQLAIDIEDVHVRRGSTSILRGVTTRIAAGSCAAILGPNGCGKTTLTRVLTGHMFMTGGRATVLGETIGRTDVRALRRRVAVVNPTADSATSHVSGAVVDGDLSAIEAVLTGYFGTVGLYDRPTDAQREHAADLLRQVGLGDRLDLRYALLSTGEQRRCLIARSLVHRPELLILDEPTAGLDLAGREQVLATIEGLLERQAIDGQTSNADGPRRPTTVLMITHHVEELSPRTSQVILMRGGQVAADGRPDDLITPESLTQTFGCKVFVRKLHRRWWVEVLPEAWAAFEGGGVIDE